MDCTKWRSLLAYSVERNAAKNLKGDDRTKAVKRISAATADWLTELRGKLRIPLWEVLYDIR
jgi:CRISPR-associated protein Csm1